MFHLCDSNEYPQHMFYGEIKKIIPKLSAWIPILPVALKFEPWHDKTNKISVYPVKTQISLGIRPVWSEPLLSAWRKFGSLTAHWAHSEDSGQTGQMPRLIWVFAGRTLILLVCHVVAHLLSVYLLFCYNVSFFIVFYACLIYLSKKELCMGKHKSVLNFHELCYHSIAYFLFRFFHLNEIMD